MKKILVVGFLALSFFITTAPVFAVGPGASCLDSNNKPDDNLCDGTLACINGKCATDPSLDATANTPTPAPAATPPAANTSTNGGTGGSPSTAFIPLLPSLPGIQDVASSNSLAPLLSQIYKICIGLAAVLAVLQIMRAGVLYMGGDSITEKKEARALIGTSLAGLLLVLSPVIVFSIINPNILKLDISAGSLGTANTSTSAAGSGSGPASNSIASSPNPAVTARECAQQTATKAVTLAPNQTCDAVAGTGFAKIDGQCCQGAAAGTTCCGYTPKNNLTPAPGPNLSATASYSISFQDKDDVGKACVTTDDRGNYASLSDCQSAFANETQQLQKKGSIFAVGKICSEASQHTPTPVDIWNKIRTLPSCSL